MNNNFRLLKNWLNIFNIYIINNKTFVREQQQKITLHLLTKFSRNVYLKRENCIACFSFMKKNGYNFLDFQD